MAEPTLFDASLFQRSQTIEARAAYSQLLVRCLVDHGYVKIFNHGIPPEVIYQAFEWNRRFFNLPSNSKTPIAHQGGATPQRGYSSPGSERTGRVYAELMGRDGWMTKRDFREHFDWGAADDERFPSKWPAETELPGFKEAMLEFYNICEEASLSILSALEQGLMVPDGTFQRLCKPHNASEARLNHYPEITMEELRSNTVIRTSPHFDLGVITLLFSDSTGGLEFQDRRQGGGEVFAPAEPEDRTTMIESVAETMQRWTHDRLPAGLHQVTIPSGMREQKGGIIPKRYSIVYFCKASHNSSVGGLTEFCGQGMPTYDHETALEYHQRRIATAY